VPNLPAPVCLQDASITDGLCTSDSIALQIRESFLSCVIDVGSGVGSLAECVQNFTHTIVSHTVLALAVAAFFLLFIRFFTGNLRHPPVDEEMRVASAKLRRMVRFSYCIALGALVITVIPFFSSFSNSASYHEGSFILVRGCVEPATRTDVPVIIACEDDRYQWLVSIGAGLKPATFTAVPTDGSASNPSVASNRPASRGQIFKLSAGLTVPLYLIVISLLGGAVSMTRRVPEIQRLATAYIFIEDHRRNLLVSENSPEQPTADNDDVILHSPGAAILHAGESAISPEIARERFVFQILQVASAPVIAVVAFELFAPASVALCVGIAFVSGFTSEQVLASVRVFADKAIPKTGVSKAGSA
jgi:hypothetical protein